MSLLESHISAHSGPGTSPEHTLAVQGVTQVCLGTTTLELLDTCFRDSQASVLQQTLEVYYHLQIAISL